jgi:hypothetical protein
VTGAAVLDPYSTSAAAQEAAKRAMAQRRGGIGGWRPMRVCSEISLGPGMSSGHCKGAKKRQNA